MSQGFILQHRHCTGNPNPIVGSKCCLSACRYQVSFNHPFDWILCKIVIYPLILFTDHVHMRLKHDWRRGFVPGGCRFTDKDIVDRVLLCLKPLIKRPI